MVKCDVQFEVKATQIKKNQILHECIISKKAEDGTIICANDTAAVCIRSTKILQGMRKGNNIIVRAGVFRYKISRSKISVIGYPFIAVFNKVGVIYNISPTSSKFLQELLSDLEKSMKKCKEHKNYDYFKKLLYPCKLTTRATQDKKFSKFRKIPIDKIFQKKKIFITLPDHIDPTEGVVLAANNIEVEHVLNPASKDLWKNDPQFIISPQYDSDKIIGQLIYQMIEYFDEIETFCKLYDTAEKIKNKQYQFTIYEKSKK